MKTRTIGFWTRIVTENQMKFVSLLYRKLSISRNHEFKWIKYVKSIQQEVGRKDFWINQNVNMPKHVPQIIKRILIDQFKQKWSQSMNHSSNGLNYRMIKKYFCTEDYLTLLPKSKYIALLKYRTANHFLPVGTLRWQGIDIS